MRIELISSRSGAASFTAFLLLSILFIPKVFAESPVIAPAAPAVPPPEVQILTLSDREACRIDEEIEYRIVVRWKERNLDIRYRTPNLPLENLSVIELTQTAENRLEGQDRIYERILSYRLKGIRPGPASIGRFTLEYSLPDSLEVSRANIEASYFQIKDLPLLQKRSVLLAAAGGGTGVLLFTALVFAWSRRARRNTGEGPEPARNITISAVEDETIAALMRLEPMLRENKSRDYLSKSGEIFKAYVQKKFDISHSRAGNLELMELLDRRRDIDADEKKKIRSILEALTESQFAGSEPTLDEARLINNKMSDFVLQKKIL